MSTYIGAFHTYGLLLTEKLTATLLENAKKNWKFTKPDSYEEIKDYEEPLEFIEYLENDNVATRFINIECYEITRLYDNESSIEQIKFLPYIFEMMYGKIVLSKKG